MEFYAQNGGVRPIRLSDKTRKFAEDSLGRKYGKQTKATPFVSLDGIEGFGELSDIEKYDIAIRKIAEEAPIRICEGELVSGAATLGWAIEHRIPAAYRGELVFMSISHLTVDFETVVKYGVNHIEAKAKEAYQKYKGTEREAFSASCIKCIEAMRIWHGRYLNELRRIPGMEKTVENLKRVPFEGARSFHEAVQSIWFVFSFLRLCGNWPGIGRIDYILGDYLERELQEGSITREEAREILSHLFIKGCEWICAENEFSVGSGDAQHYQNIILGGRDSDGEEITSAVTYLVVDIIEELGIGDFPTSVRLHKNSPPELVKRVAEVMKLGGGVLAVYNEDLVIDALVKAGYDRREAYRFGNDGCWEVQIPGETFFCYIPFDSLQILQRKTLGEYSAECNFESFDALYEAFISDLRCEVEKIYENKMMLLKRNSTGEFVFKKQMPCTAVSIFERGCIEKGLSYLEGGPVYNIVSPHIGGLSDTASSLYAIKKLVFDDKRVTFSALMEILRANWEGAEELRLIAKNKYTYYGNDNDEADDVVARILSDFADICSGLNGRCPYRFPAGVSTFGRQLEWAPRRLASPHGRKAKEVLAANCSPTPGSDREGATAIIKSYCKSDLSKLATGAALDIRLLPSSVSGDSGVGAIEALLRGFVNLGGFFMQPDVVDASLLKAAQEHPENYETLAVRVSGWNARFVTLNKQWQDMVIAQNEH